MSSNQVKDLEPVTRALVSRLLIRMEEVGYPVRCTCTYRSVEEQNIEYAKGRGVGASGKVVTRARGGQSPHNYRMAADLIFVAQGYDGPWKVVGKIAQEVGLTWGGAWKVFVDRPHVERPDWRKYIV